MIITIKWTLGSHLNIDATDLETSPDPWTPYIQPGTLQKWSTLSSSGEKYTKETAARSVSSVQPPDSGVVDPSGWLYGRHNHFDSISLTSINSTTYEKDAELADFIA